MKSPITAGDEFRDQEHKEFIFHSLLYFLKLSFKRLENNFDFSKIERKETQKDLCFEI